MFVGEEVVGVICVFVFFYLVIGDIWWWGIFGGDEVVFVFWEYWFGILEGWVLIMFFDFVDCVFVGVVVVFVVFDGWVGVLGCEF